MCAFCTLMARMIEGSNTEYEKNVTKTLYGDDVPGGFYVGHSVTGGPEIFGLSSDPPREASEPFNRVYVTEIDVENCRIVLSSTPPEDDRCRKVSK